MCWQVSSRLASGAEALKTSGDMRSLNLRQSISGALQRVSGIRSPGASAPEPGESSQRTSPWGSWPGVKSLSATQHFCLEPTVMYNCPVIMLHPTQQKGC